MSTNDEGSSPPLKSQAEAYQARLVQVARAYYLEHQTQEAIARSFGISRSLVSRYLTAAREQGIVRIEVVDPAETSYQLGQTLKLRFPSLRDVVVAPTLHDDPAATRVVIGRCAADYLLRIMEPGHRLTLGCGRTLRALVDALPRRRFPGSIVVQAMGNIGHEAHNLDYNEIARQAADALAARVYYISAPAILGKGSGRAVDLIQTNPTLEYALSLAKAADIFVVGLGTLDSDQLYARTGLIQTSDLDDLRGRAVGDICGRFFALDGTEQRAVFSERIVGIELGDLRRGVVTIGVAGGHDKVEAIHGALCGRYINTLVTDRQTLQQLLEFE